ncbi:sarcoplasmic calcium-binding protein-like isoform X1 [Ostrea edulis]|uniref:sarcoplasmic calcium-binding protein-like isoform X1 n=1 Tax=Ostrea edulis TaxID=37623 RepID=UPI0020962EDC|nr:sarcoplasmic calcium-binding protein-like isoform X1 [Ostrea edulis]
MDYLTKKWKIWYTSLDVNHDGKISFEDVEESRNKFTNLHELVGDKATGVKVDFEKWWNTYIFRTGPGKEISEDEFVDSLKAAYNKDKKGFKAEIQKCFDEIFDVIDTNKDRSIELDEFIYAFKAFGHENEELIRKAFALYKAPSGLVPLRDIVSEWVKFITEEDSSVSDIIMEAFKTGL